MNQSSKRQACRHECAVDGPRGLSSRFALLFHEMLAVGSSCARSSAARPDQSWRSRTLRREKCRRLEIRLVARRGYASRPLLDHLMAEVLVCCGLCPSWEQWLCSAHCDEEYEQDALRCYNDAAVASRQMVLAIAAAAFFSVAVSTPSRHCVSSSGSFPTTRSPSSLSSGDECPILLVAFVLWTCPCSELMLRCRGGVADLT
jgi:hypothetical protein